MKTNIFFLLFFLLGFGLGVTSRYIIKFLISLWDKYFVPQRIKIKGTIVSVDETIEVLPFFQLDLDGTMVPKQVIKIPLYLVKVFTNNNYCLVKVSYKLFLRFKKQLNRGRNSFSRLCEKEWGDNYFTLIENNNQSKI